MRVRIDESWEDVFPGCVDDFGPGGRCDVFVDARDSLAFAEDVGGVTGVRVDNISVLDEQSHSFYLSLQIEPSP